MIRQYTVNLPLLTTRLVTLPVSRHRLTRSLVGPIPSGLLMCPLFRLATVAGNRADT